MDKLIKEDYFDACIEYCISEIVGIHFGGFHVPSKERMNAAMEKDLPTIITPGCANLIALGKMETLTADQKNRQLYKHNPEIMLIRTNEKEMRTIATTVAEKMNMSKNNVKIFIPLKGFCSQDQEGGALWDINCDMVFLEVMKEKLRKDIEIIEIDAHINDKEFSEAVIETMFSMINKSIT